MSVPKHLDWSDPKACAEWLGLLETAVENAIAVGEDQVRPSAQRDLGRRAARAALAEATHSIESLLAFARAGLDVPAELGPSNPAGNGSAKPSS